MTKNLAYLSILGMVLISSCYYDNEEELYPFENCNLPETVSFMEDVDPIISSNCAVSGCHIQGGEGNGIFTTYDVIKSKVDNGTFSNRVFEVGDMAGPQYGNISECEIQILEKWVQQGAPNN